MWVSPPVRQWKSPGLDSTGILSLSFAGKPMLCRRFDSSISASKLTPWTLLAVPLKQRWIISSANPTASNICAPL